MKNMLVAVIVIVASAGSAFAYSFSDINTESWTGSGANQAMMIVDFGSGHNYAFGYNFSGSPTGWDMFQAIVEASGSTFTYAADINETGTPITVFTAAGGTLTAQGDIYSWGKIMEMISYDGHSLQDHYYTSGEVVAYWNSTDGASWTGNLSGVTGRTLADGDWDGYTIGQYDSNYNLVGDVPSVPTPEPATMALMAIGAGLLMNRNRRKTA